MRFGNFFKRRGFADGFAAFAAEKIIDAVARDAAEPSAQLVALAQMAEMFPRGDEISCARSSLWPRLPVAL